MSAQTRIVIVVNKYWECDPVSWVLTNVYLNDTMKNVCNINQVLPQLVNYPYGPVPSPLPVARPTPRLLYVTPKAYIEIWCISDLLSKFPNTSAYQSSSQRKMEVLDEVFAYSPLPVSLVVAVGTASSGPFCPTYQGAPQTNINGSVIVGSKIFMHDGHPASDPNLNSEWRCSYFDQLKSSSLSDSAIMAALGVGALETALLCPPTNPATNGQHIYVSGDYVAIGDVNVTDYKEYAAKDKEAGDAFKAYCEGNINGVSLETTHGLIYAAAHDYFHGDPPFLFVSGVVDRFTMFDADVSPKVYAQNITGAHNAGIVIAQLVAGLS